MSAAVWTLRRAKRDLRRGRWTRHVDRLRVSQLADMPFHVVIRAVPREDQ